MKNNLEKMKQKYFQKNENPLFTLVSLFYNENSKEKILIIIQKLGIFTEHQKLELEKMIMKEYYDEKFYNQKEILKSNLQNFSNHLDNDTLKYMCHYFEKTIFFDEVYSKRFTKIQEDLNIAKNELTNTKKELNSTKKNLNTAKKQLEYAKKEINNSKLDLIGIITGVLSIIAIFGTDYAFLTNFLSETKMFKNIISFGIAWTIFNIILMIIITTMLENIKNIFTNYSKSINKSNKLIKTKNIGSINLNILLNQTFVLSFIAILLAIVLNYVNK